MDKIHQVPGAEFTMGDMHGNAIKFIFMLIKQGVVSNISEKEYEKLLEIYRKPNNTLTKDDLQNFREIIDKMAVNTNCFVRLIGDELGDRGKNDYFTLLLLSKLHQAGLPMEIMLSNHGAEFINKFANTQYFQPGIVPKQILSLNNIIELIKSKLISEEEVRDITTRAYKPYLKAISYLLAEDKTEISIYSHAPIGIRDIMFLAEQFKIQFADKTPEQLAKTIDSINVEFKKFVDADTVSQQINTKESSLAYFIWNKNEKIPRSSEYNGFKVNYVHGHTGTEGYYNNQNHILNLNNILGQLFEQPDHIGIYSLAFQISQQRLIDRLSAQISNDENFQTLMLRIIQEAGSSYLENQTLMEHLNKLIGHSNLKPNHIRMIMLSVISEEHKELQSALKEILNKTEQFGDSYKEYSDAAKELFDTIIQNYASISQGKLKKEDFFQNCNKAIDKALVTLDKNRDTLPKIINLIAKITLLPALLKKLLTRQWNIFQTDSSKKVQHLKEKIQISIFQTSATSNSEEEGQRLITKKSSV